MQKYASSSSLGSNSDLNSLQMPKKTLEDALHVVKVNSFHMKKAIESHSTSSNPATTLTTPTNTTNNNTTTENMLKYVVNMLGELSEGQSAGIDPKSYYELYMAIFDELRHFQLHLQESCLSNSPPLSSPSTPPQSSTSTTSIPRDNDNGVFGGGKLNTMQIHKTQLAELYEKVQYVTLIVPRLYLMITIGSVYMTQSNSPKRELLFDLMDMVKGVQHPMRGLFLRYFLLQSLKNILPSSAQNNTQNISLDTDKNDCSFEDTVLFLLSNFTEMNKLWVRLQYQGLTKDRLKREQERKELRLLVGSNLVCLSQLDGLSLETYETVVLPRILEQVVSCKDVIAQEYLMEAIIQVFQDDFHLKTLDPLLEATGKLHPSVNVKNILIAFVDRNSAYAKRERDQSNGEKRSVLQDIALFEIFWQQVSNIIKNRIELTLEDVIALLQSLANFAMSCYPETISYYDQILGLCHQKIAAAKNEEVLKPSTSRMIMSILSAPLKTYPSILTILKNTATADKTSSVIAVLPFSLRHSISMVYLNDILEKQTEIGEQDHVARLLCEWLGPLIKDQADNPGNIANGIETWRDEQIEIAKFVHLLKNEYPDQQFIILNTAKKFFSEGGANRIAFTLPPLIYECMKVGRLYTKVQITNENTIEMTEKKRNVLFKFMHQTISLLQQNGHFATALQLFLAPISDSTLCAGMEMIAYEYMVQAFTIYEESISDTKLQISLLYQMIGALFKASNTGVFTAENYDTLITKCTVYSAKLLKKEDQCRLVLSCAALFWGRDMEECDMKRIKVNNPDMFKEETPKSIQSFAPSSSLSNIPGLEVSPWADESQTQEVSPSIAVSIPSGTETTTVPLSASTIPGIDKWFYRDGKRVLECLQKSLKIADSCMDSCISAQLFVEILNFYIFHFEKENPAITVKYVNGLIDLVYSNIQTLHSDPAAQSATLSPIDDGTSNNLDSKSLNTVKRIVKFFQSTLKHLKNLKEKAMGSGYEEQQRWEPISLEDVLANISEWN